MSFANTDMAFKDNLLVAGNYHGFNMYEIKNDGIPSLVSSVVCPGGQGDVSIVGNILIMSVEQNRSRIDCGSMGVGKDASSERFRGIRILIFLIELILFKLEQFKLVEVLIPTQ